MILLLLSNTAATVRTWLHGPLLTAAAQQAPAPPSDTGFRNKHRDLPRYIDELDEDEEEAIFGLLAGHVFG